MDMHKNCAHAKVVLKDGRQNGGPLMGINKMVKRLALKIIESTVIKIGQEKDKIKQELDD